MAANPRNQLPERSMAIAVSHRPQEHLRLITHHAIAPVAGQRDHRRVGDQMVKDHVVVESQPVHGGACWRCHRQHHPNVGLLLGKRAHPTHRHRPGPPVGAAGRTRGRNPRVPSRSAALLPEYSDGRPSPSPVRRSAASIRRRCRCDGDATLPPSWAWDGPTLGSLPRGTGGPGGVVASVPQKENSAP